jgi:hypothetical protein
MALDEFRSIYLPYCIEKQQDGSWVVLNREYKPVGFNTTEWITYSDFPVSVRLKGLGPAKLARISYNGSVEGNRVFLYDDGCIPTSNAHARKAYLERLFILAKLQVG